MTRAAACRYSADMTLPVLNMVVEADGLSHFARTTGELLGSTALKRRHLQHLGWKVISVSLQEWEEQIGPGARKHFLKVNTWGKKQEGRHLGLTKGIRGSCSTPAVYNSFATIEFSSPRL